MIKNVGKIDRSLRFILGLFLIWLGLWRFNGIDGNYIGLLISITSLLPLYMSFSGACFVFHWFKIHSFSKTECKINGTPYQK